LGYEFLRKSLAKPENVVAQNLFANISVWLSINYILKVSMSGIIIIFLNLRM
jgi:hypothetical protein